MKATEVMLGDWVMLADPIHNGENVQVKEIHANDYITVDGGIVPMFEPIPLTAEILEKNFNSIENLPYRCRYYYNTDYTEVDITEYTDGIWQVVVDEVEMSCLPTWKMYVSYVHELQHALRLVGILKEIEL